MNVLIEGVPADKHWRVVRAALDVIEPGAASHALQHTPLHDGVETYEHVRLGVTVTLNPTPKLAMPSNVKEWLDMADAMATWAAAFKAELDETGGSKHTWAAWQCLLDASNHVRSVGVWQHREDPTQPTE